MENDSSGFLWIESRKATFQYVASLLLSEEKWPSKALV